MRVAANGSSVPRWEVQHLINSLVNGRSVAIVTVGTDLARSVFEFAVAEEHWRVVETQRPAVNRLAVTKKAKNESNSALAPGYHKKYAIYNVAI